MSLRKEISFTINGSPKRASVPVTMSALAMIRDELGLTGTKYGCGEGECGACTILVDGRSVNACLQFAVDCDGRELTTIEGLGNDPAAERLRAAFVANGAVQCGFCTPGMIMSAKALLEKNPAPTEDDVKEAIAGNLCRCTGYVKIIEAVTSLAKGRQ